MAPPANCRLSASPSAPGCDRAGRGDEGWVRIGPPGGDVRSLAADPRDPRVIYLGTADGVLYRSEDAGRRWRGCARASRSAGMSLDDIVVGPDGALFVGYWEVQRLGGRGRPQHRRRRRPSRCSPASRARPCAALAQAPADPKVLVAGTLTGVFRSEDGGRDLAAHQPRGTRRDPQRRLGGHRPPRPSRDLRRHLAPALEDRPTAGATWHPVKTGMIDDSDVMTLTLDRRDPTPSSPPRAAGSTARRTRGAQWSRIRGIPSSSRRTRAFAQDPSRPDTLYAGTTEGLWRSDDGAATWRRRHARGPGGQRGAAAARRHGAAGHRRGGRAAQRGRRANASSPSNDGLLRALRDSGRGATRVGGASWPGSGQDRRHGGVFTATDGRLRGRAARRAASRAARSCRWRSPAKVRTRSFSRAPTTASSSTPLHCGLWRRLPTVVAGVEAHPE